MTGLELAALGALAYLLFGHKARATAIPETVIRASAPAPNAVPWPAATRASTPIVVPGMRGLSMTAPAVVTHATAVPQNELAALVARERAPFEASYWMPAKKVSPSEAQAAQALLASPTWKNGAVVFGGPATMLGRRQFRAGVANGKKNVTIWQPRPPFVA